MQNWDEVRLGLMALGYRRVLTVEIVCIAHGTFRGAIEDEAELYPCPECRGASTLGAVVEGFTRHELPPWEKRARPLSDKTRAFVMAEWFGESRPDILRNRRAKRVVNRLRRGQWLNRAKPAKVETEPVDLRSRARSSGKSRLIV